MKEKNSILDWELNPGLQLYVLVRYHYAVQDNCQSKVELISLSTLDRQLSWIAQCQRTVTHVEFASGGVRPLPLDLRGQFLLNYNNFVYSENTISEHMAIFKVNIQNFFRFCIHFFNFKLYYFEIGNSAQYRARRLRWSRGYHTRHWTRGSRVLTRAWSMDFLERKSPEYDFLRKGSKAVGPCRRFTARTRTSSRNQSL